MIRNHGTCFMPTPDIDYTERVVWLLLGALLFVAVVVAVT